ncbi:MAG: phosphodiester glycosidase family protein [Cyanobacteria bacterium P01_H01_bin.105]
MSGFAMQLGKKLAPWLLVLLGVAVGLTQCAVPSEQSEPVIPASTLDILQPNLTIQNWPSDNAPVARVHVVTIPPNYPVEVAVSDELKPVENFVTDTGAIAALNGGFFDPNNGQTTSFITVNGSLVADPRENQRLVNNPDLAPYIEQILNRSEFRRYDCDDGVRYDITGHNSVVPDGCTLHSALGAGPQLLPDDASLAEGFTDYANGIITRDAIGSLQRNARTAIGITENDTLVWVMVAQTEPAGGMTLAELAEFMSILKLQKALNLDGGSSSSLALFDWVSSGPVQSSIQNYYGRLDSSGKPIQQRPVKSVLVIQRHE